MSRLIPLLLLMVVSLAAISTPAAAGDGSWAWPVPHEGPLDPEHGFNAPDTRYGPGHRGIDVPTVVGAPVGAVAAGAVSFVGTVAGVGVVSVDHGAERSTYQPVTASVEVGQSVAAGETIGTVSLGPFHCGMPCLHLGRIDSTTDQYLDPLDRLSGTSHIQLVDPDGPPPVPPLGSTGAGVLQRPVAGPVTSPFGTRTHPITGKRTFHDGVDLGAPCGSAVRAAGPGTVVGVGRAGAYGLRVTVRHDGGLESSYSHLADASVAKGDSVSGSTVVGKVGSSGLSTGCHLHFGVHRDGTAVDPLTLL